MPRKLFAAIQNREDGQALVLFAAGLIAFLGLVGMSIDVGRLVWARTSIQAGVDASALAAAQSMPDVSDGVVKANEYWLSNSTFIRNQGTNVHFSVTFPPGNKALSVHADAQVDTWFLRLFGIDHWDVSADGDAASQVLDIAMVLDISGSTCWGSYPPTAKTPPSGPFGAMTGPGRTADQVKLTVANIPASSAASITINVNSTAIFNSTTSAQNLAKFGYNTTTKYYLYAPTTVDPAGIILIDNEVFKITAIPTATTMTVSRAQANTFLGTTPPMALHNIGAVVKSHHANCDLSAPSSAGPFDYADTIVSDAQYFTTLFNSSYDHIGLTKFSASGTLVNGLTSNFALLNSDMAAFGAPAGGTNSAHGIAVGRQVLDGAGNRGNAVRVLVFLTDGLANSYCGGSYSAANYNTTTCPSPGGADSAAGWTRGSGDAWSETARLVADKNTIIYTIGVGPYVSDSFLQRMADGGVSGVGPCQNNLPNCHYYKAPTPADLAAAFTSVAQSTHIALIK
jgi:hypothetical protein